MFFICKLFFFFFAEPRKQTFQKQPFNCLPLVRAGGGKKEYEEEMKKERAGERKMRGKQRSQALFKPVCHKTER